MSSKATTSRIKSKTVRLKPAKDLSLLISIDYGTKFLSVSWRLAEPGRDPSEIHTVWFSTQSADAPQIIAWLKDGSFYWGWDAVHALESKQIRREHTFELWKLALYKNHKTSDIAKDVDEHLGRLGKNIHDLLSTHLHAVITEAMKKIKETALVYFDGDVEQLPKKLMLSVPQMWKPPVNRIMASATRALGFQKTQLVYEPQCAVGYFAWLLQKQRQNMLKPGGVLLVADSGGGTGDISSYIAKKGNNDGPRLELELIGQPTGALCGSEFVNRKFLQWLKGQPAYKTELARSKLSEFGFLREASTAFEETKLKFHPASPGPYRVLIAFGEKEWLVKLSRDEIIKFFTPILDEVLKCIDSQLMAETQALIVPGGFGKSPLLQEALQDSYGQKLKIFGEHNLAQCLQQPVSQGALLRYKEVIVRDIPSSSRFGFAQVEWLDEKIHPDAFYSIGSTTRGGQPVRSTARINRDIANWSDFYREDCVWERWVSIFEGGAIPDATGKWQRFVVEPGQTTISVQIYWTELNIADHAPTRTGKDDTSDLIDCIEPWGDPIVLQLPDMKKTGFRLVETQGKHAYEIDVLLTIDCDGANISVRGQIARQDQGLYDAYGVRTEGFKMLASGQVVDVWEQDFSPSVRD